MAKRLASAPPTANITNRQTASNSVVSRVFGSPRVAPINVACTIAVLLVATGIGLAFLPGSIGFESYWKVTLPLLTAVLGYMFGAQR